MIGIYITGKGVYQLLIELPKGRNVTVGRLGRFYLPAGRYVYTGSGQSGWRRRLDRHVNGREKRHWHIDYLLKHASVKGYRVFAGGKEEECYWNRKFLKIGGKPLIKGFGSSDCSCPSHLLFLRGDERPRQGGDEMAKAATTTKKKTGRSGCGSKKKPCG